MIRTFPHNRQSASLLLLSAFRTPPFRTLANPCIFIVHARMRLQPSGQTDGDPSPPTCHSDSLALRSLNFNAHLSLQVIGGKHIDLIAHPWPNGCYHSEPLSCDQF